jgi:hypothetical protein
MGTIEVGLEAVKKYIWLLFCLMLYPGFVRAIDLDQEHTKRIDVEKESRYRKFAGTTIGGQWYISYLKGKEGGERYSEFIINRGYIIIKKEFNAYYPDASPRYLCRQRR